MRGGGADVGSLGTVLGVWAHPDDEAFLSAALMASAVDAGQRVAVVTATRGERGTDDPGRWPPERLGRLRSYELTASLAVLGVREHRWLGWQDGTCADVPPDEGAAAVLAAIEEVRPDTILTFGPDGLTGHGDHRAVSAWVDEAWRSSDRTARVLHATCTPSFARRFAGLNRRFSVFAGGVPPTTPDDDLAFHLVAGGDLLDRKVAALRAQASQLSPLHDAVGHETFRQWWAEEAFRPAIVRAPRGAPERPGRVQHVHTDAVVA